MTISNNAPRVQLIADGTTGPYPFKFRIFSEDDVRVFDGATQKELTTHYTVDFDFLDESAEEGAINFVSGQQPVALTVITIDRNIPNERPNDLQQNGPPVQVELNRDGDKIWAKLQEIAQTFLRLVRLADTTAFTGDVIFPDGGPAEAGKVVGWASDGLSLENKELVAAGVIGLPLIVGEGGTGATTATEARTNLGLGAVAVEDEVPTAKIADNAVTTEKLTGLTGFITPGGGVLSIDASDTDHAVNVTPVIATADDGSELIVLPTEITKLINAAWAVGDDAGGLDTGDVAPNALYWVWLIKRTDMNVRDVLLSLSSTDPTMPANYDKKRRIGFVRTNPSSNLYGFTWQEDGNYFWDPIDPSGASSFTVGGLPPGIRRMDFFANEISMSGADEWGIRLGTSGGIEAAGYLGQVERERATAANQAWSTNNLMQLTREAGATNTLIGAWQMNLADPSNNTWSLVGAAMKGAGLGTTAAQEHSFGQKDLSGELAQFQLLATGGNTFDAGRFGYRFFGHPNPRSL